MPCWPWACLRRRPMPGLCGPGGWGPGRRCAGTRRAAWQRGPGCEVALLCDVVRERAVDTAGQFGIARVSDDWHTAVSDPALDIIDIATPSHTHFELAMAALAAGKHVLCEKPVAYDFRDTRRAAELARSRGLLTKLGFTFRYSPGVQYAKSLIDDGFVGQPYIFNGYEQNSQWLDPQVPLRQVDHTADQSVLQTSSLEGYGAPIIDIGMWWVGAGYARTAGIMRNFVPERMVRATGRMMRMNIDDGDIHLVEYANGAMGSIQTSFVTVGNYPGVEARLYGSKGAIIWRLVEEGAVVEIVWIAGPVAVEFKSATIPPSCHQPGAPA